MCLVRPALLYLSVHVLRVFYEQMNYYYYYYFPCRGVSLCIIVYPRQYK